METTIKATFQLLDNYSFGMYNSAIHKTLWRSAMSVEIRTTKENISWESVAGLLSYFGLSRSHLHTTAKGSSAADAHSPTVSVRQRYTTLP